MADAAWADALSGEYLVFDTTRQQTVTAKVGISYTSDTDAALNLSLSQKRAEAVRQALIKYGADPDMLVAKGYGEADPIASNDTAEGRLKNRRIEYHVVKAPT